jgi:hypothetical protein
LPLFLWFPNFNLIINFRSRTIIKKKKRITKKAIFELMLMDRITAKPKMLIKEMTISIMLLWDMLPMKILILGVYLNWLDSEFALQRSSIQVL